MAILTTIEELKNYVEVAKSLRFDTVKPSLNTAETRHLKKILGEDLFLRLSAAYKNASNKVDDMPEELKELAVLSQKACANIGLSLLISRISANVSESGITRFENPAQKSAYQYQETNLRESYLREGFDTLDDILGYLESHKSDFPEWVASTAYLDYTKYFIRSSEEFSSYYNIQQSRLAFLAVRYIMKRIEDFAVKDVIGSKLFDVVKSQIKSGAVTPQNQKLLDDYICPAIALITVAKGVWERALDISEYGVTVSVRGNTNNNDLRETASLSKQQKMADQLLADGNDYLSRLGVFLDKNIDDYPDFEQPVAENQLFTIINKKDNGIYGA
nr:DUF6712 family protein [Pedobacter sp. ASV19]